MPSTNFDLWSSPRKKPMNDERFRAALAFDGARLPVPQMMAAARPAPWRAM